MAELDQETISLALVGRFLKRVCDLEERLNEAIAGILNIDDTKRFILCANISFRNKINILRSFVRNSSLTDHDKEQFDIELVKIGNLYERRNTLAHQYFKLAPNGDGVIFSIVKIKGVTAPLDTMDEKRVRRSGHYAGREAGHGNTLKDCPYWQNIRGSAARPRLAYPIVV